MTRRDFAWRAAGALMVVIGYAAIFVGRETAIEPLIVALGLAFGFVGLLLAIQGRHLVMALKIERSRHRHLPDVIRARRTTRRSKL